ncbi:SAF domain-containing protein [Iamia majanohamensis]|uniref:SAF domain-containing protein n=1 Tax=Iamia majanohamensis TaxID=467976 RepID=A0AAF0BWX0_9ACTN|nr:SAF domain-containing protein [Iamia majanohamensis]WCO67944.1 SAF domain-containing protein [Iamia majanohamensis]
MDIRPPGRRVRVPEVAVGLLVTVVFALGAVLWHLSTVEKDPALVVASNVERGDVIESIDVRIGYVSSDDPLARLDSSQLDQVVGRVASVDLAEGTLLTTSVVADGPAVDAGDGVVGLALDPGAYPARGLAPGDRVNVVRTADVADLDADPIVVARNASVSAVDELASDRLLVSVLTTEADAEAVAAVAGAGGLRLVLVTP